MFFPYHMTHPIIRETKVLLLIYVNPIKLFFFNLFMVRYRLTYYRNVACVYLNIYKLRFSTVCFDDYSQSATEINDFR